MSLEVGFIGAGQMGEPMVVRLLEAGHRVRLFARNSGVTERLRSRGAQIADSTMELARTSDILIGCLFSDAQLLDVALGADGLLAHMKPDSVFVSHTTGSVEVLQRIAASRQQRDVAVVDAPISGTADEIMQGRLGILLGGSAAAVERVTPVLSSYGDHVVATGALGSALNVKLVNNLLFTANLQLVGEAVNLGVNLGIAPDALLRALAFCSGSSQAVSRALEAGGIDHFSAIAKPFLRKDVAVCLETARELGSDTGLLGHVATTGPLDLAPADTAGVAS